MMLTHIIMRTLILYEFSVIILPEDYNWHNILEEYHSDRTYLYIHLIIIWHNILYKPISCATHVTSYLNITRKQNNHNISLAWWFKARTWRFDPTKVSGYAKLCFGFNHSLIYASRRWDWYLRLIVPWPDTYKKKYCAFLFFCLPIS